MIELLRFRVLEEEVHNETIIARVRCACSGDIVGHRHVRAGGCEIDIARAERHIRVRCRYVCSGYPINDDVVQRNAVHVRGVVTV